MYLSCTSHFQPPRSLKIRSTCLSHPPYTVPFLINSTEINHTFLQFISSCQVIKAFSLKVPDIPFTSLQSTLYSSLSDLGYQSSSSLFFLSNPGYLEVASLAPTHEPDSASTNVQRPCSKRPGPPTCVTTTSPARVSSRLQPESTALLFLAGLPKLTIIIAPKVPCTNIVHYFTSSNTTPLWQHPASSCDSYENILSTAADRF
ncbi:hypothetical protein HD806DRAFT_155808 [Xylariaceae sp. AK1471]|nr:hypothetical protein HD806DRAFT_155808 [Xylariaceae sp. AK1471]